MPTLLPTSAVQHQKNNKARKSMRPKYRTLRCTIRDTEINHRCWSHVTFSDVLTHVCYSLTVITIMRKWFRIPPTTSKTNKHKKKFFYSSIITCSWWLLAPWWVRDPPPAYPSVRTRFHFFPLPESSEVVPPACFFFLYGTHKKNTEYVGKNVSRATTQTTTTEQKTQSNSRQEVYCRFRGILRGGWGEDAIDGFSTNVINTLLYTEVPLRPPKQRQHQLQTLVAGKGEPTQPVQYRKKGHSRAHIKKTGLARGPVRGNRWVEGHALYVHQLPHKTRGVYHNAPRKCHTQYWVWYTSGQYELAINITCSTCCSHHQYNFLESGQSIA